MSILFMGHKTSSSKGFLEALKDESFQVTVDTDIENATELIANHKIDVLVCALSPDSPDWAKIEDLSQRYPRFPMLLILPHDSRVEPFFTFDGFHCVHRPLTEKGAFIQTLRNLIQVGQWTKQGEAAAAGEASSNFFESLDLFHVIDKLLKHFGTQVDCKNLFWLQCSELERFIEAREVGEELDTAQFYNRSAYLQALHDASESEVFDVLEDFGLSSKYLHKPIALHQKDPDNHENLVVPITHNGAQGEILSYFVFKGVNTENATFLIKQINETLNLFSSHIKFSLEYWSARSENYLDDLTGLYNQKYMSLVVDNEINRATRRETKFSVLFLDVDFFKVVNDTRGHWIGSKVLVALGKILKNSIRACDYAFRYGGDEYVMVLPDTNTEQAQIVAERIRAHIEGHEFEIDGVELTLTVSIGLATFPDHAESRKDVIKMADQAMYCGKNKSRNIVYVAG